LKNQVSKAAAFIALWPIFNNRQLMHAKKINKRSTVSGVATHANWQINT